MSTIEMIRAAQARLTGVARRTPLLNSPYLDEIAGRRVYVKAEPLQHTGSFKFRGAWAAISALEPQTRARGILAYSSGNHAQGIAHAATLHGAPSVVVMPEDAPALKVANTKALGAEVVLYDRFSQSREDIGEAVAADRGLTMVRPYDDPQVIAGQGTCGLEIAEQAADVGASQADVMVCCGGGGLTSGIALALEADAPNMRVRPVEPSGFDDVIRSLETGTIQSNPTMGGSICDAIVTPQPGELTFPILQRLCGPGIVVSDEDALRAVALAALRLKLVVEPGGAVALAAALFHPKASDGDSVIAVATGGNIDPGLLAETLKNHASPA